VAELRDQVVDVSAVVEQVHLVWRKTFVLWDIGQRAAVGTESRLPPHLDEEPVLAAGVLREVLQNGAPSVWCSSQPASTASAGTSSFQ